MLLAAAFVVALSALPPASTPNRARKRADLPFAVAAALPPGPDFRDIAREAGLTAPFPNGGERTKEYII